MAASEISTNVLPTAIQSRAQRTRSIPEGTPPESLLIDALKLLAALLDHQASRIDHGRKHTRRSRRRPSASPRPLTEQQRRALELYGEHRGKIGDIAVAMNITHSTVHQHLEAAWRKLPSLSPNKARPAGKVERLPEDRRGQPSVGS